MKKDKIEINQQWTNIHEKRDKNGNLEGHIFWYGGKPVACGNYTKAEVDEITKNMAAMPNIRS